MNHFFKYSIIVASAASLLIGCKQNEKQQVKSELEIGRASCRERV